MANITKTSILLTIIMRLQNRQKLRYVICEQPPNEMYCEIIWQHSNLSQLIYVLYYNMTFIIYFTEFKKK